MTICTQFFTTAKYGSESKLSNNFSESPSAEVKIKLSPLSTDTSSQTGRHDLHIKTLLTADT